MLELIGSKLLVYRGSFNEEVLSVLGTNKDMS
jgi:hypothetical protein